jgi:hypothetical protein
MKQTEQVAKTSCVSGILNHHYIRLFKTEVVADGILMDHNVSGLNFVDIVI